jgi:hypothetical protein
MLPAYKFPHISANFQKNTKEIAAFCAKMSNFAPIKTNDNKERN